MQEPFPDNEEPPSSPAGPSRSIGTSNKNSGMPIEGHLDSSETVTSPLILLNFDQRLHVVNRHYSKTDTKGISYIFSVIGMFKDKYEAQDFIVKHHTLEMETDLLYDILIRSNIVPWKEPVHRLKFSWTIMNEGSERVRFGQTTIEFDSSSMEVHFWYPDPSLEPAQLMRKSIPQFVSTELHDAPQEGKIRPNADCSQMSYHYSTLNDALLGLESLSIAENQLEFNVDDGNLTPAHDEVRNVSSRTYTNESAITNSEYDGGPVNWLSGVEIWAESYVLDPPALVGPMNTSTSTRNEHFEQLNTRISDTLQSTVNYSCSTGNDNGKDITTAITQRELLNA